ncbi:HD domain-containing protein [Streptococcus anginosus]|uniref:HD domain-containing protein n=1 Tax=Streptococcus anginosus TaxID=1328 RepID=UPI001247DC12|nr:HD domain-containing protein [Streptococcus anginosus]KAA9322728.1 HD domain-containing protein [Streptococcus anginosus]MCW1037802.1 HD domain-containing protein [Streptococcus anginosus]MCW1056170.1 HD domain-containing protein [Streptococcus anginosus]MED5764976.1 HD domain-containing protein [Streptococcus anginosus]MED5841390.1 HD domain-containing protein [Streptococcus anginosus]
MITDRQAKILQEARDFVYAELKDEMSGHDWWHIVRVTNNAVEIATHEQADVFICELAALLHDIADGKLNENEEVGLQKVEQWLQNHQASDAEIAHVLDIISTMSFKGGHQQKNVSTLEGKIVQDADRLDAIGAIGIARAMAYSGHIGRPIHDPDLQPRENMTLEEYRAGKSSAIMHFYEKLLKLKDLMNTDYAKQLAIGRHHFLEEYLEQFYAEWDAKK